ncbi:MAG TPA: indole-3-glycerol phosphate synthase TrpC [Firmicutes bacterium]|nr:indole-3-glycerol phosphate synthase TrpC [Bacillota bacterium]
MILDDIVAKRRLRLAHKMASTPQSHIERLALSARPPRDFVGALRRRDRVALIAEVKPASPSKGRFRDDFDPIEVAREYVDGGADAISVLTEPDFFLGDIATLSRLRRELPLPLLCKDFFLTPYQVYEARASGADAVLLIAAILDDYRLNELLQLAHGLGMAALVEVHDPVELTRAEAAGARLIGINNRDLKTFRTDLDVTGRLAPLVPPGATLVSESGIRQQSDMQRLRGWGVHAALVGEALMTAPDIKTKVRELVMVPSPAPSVAAQPGVTPAGSGPPSHALPGSAPLGSALPGKALVQGEDGA